MRGNLLRHLGSLSLRSTSFLTGRIFHGSRLGGGHSFPWMLCGNGWRERRRGVIDFREIRARVPAQDAVRFYGAKFDRRGWAICPFHGDTHPSISFKHGRFRCWSCGVSGDALDYVSRLFDLDSVQAGRKLDTDFHLGLSREHIDAREMERQETERRAIAGLHERFETWRGKTIDLLNEVCYIAHTSLKRLPAPLSDREALAVRFSARAGYFSDLLEAGTPEDQAKIFQEREEVDTWTARILNGS